MIMDLHFFSLLLPKLEMNLAATGLEKAVLVTLSRWSTMVLNMEICNSFVRLII